MEQGAKNFDDICSYSRFSDPELLVSKFSFNVFQKKISTNHENNTSSIHLVINFCMYFFFS